MPSPLALLTNAVLIFDSPTGEDLSGGVGTPTYLGESFILIAYLKRLSNRGNREDWGGSQQQQQYKGYAITPATLPFSLQNQQVAAVDFYGAGVSWPTTAWTSVPAYEIFKAANQARLGLSGSFSLGPIPPSQVGVDELIGRGFEGTFTQKAQWADVV